MVALSKVIRWEVGQANEFDRTLTPEEIMDKLEQRVGPEGRKLFEQFLRKVNKLQAQQQLGRAGTDRTGCADFPLPVLHGRASLAAVYRWTIRAAGSGLLRVFWESPE